MGDSRSWAAEMEDETKVCSHGVESKYFENCMCDGCVSDRSVSAFKKSLKDKIVSHFREYLDSLSIEELQAMVEKIK